MYAFAASLALVIFERPVPRRPFDERDHVARGLEREPVRGHARPPSRGKPRPHIADAGGAKVPSKATSARMAVTQAVSKARLFRSAPSAPR
jgi:hypothetical protein